ncbi:MAG: NAD(P)-dependent oxidoreductase [Clostridiales bacterium]|nr:NAD(P)-dependent oxidoreductase [Clostridiales bacterium]
MMELTGKRVVMTGVTGFIGSHVAQMLLAEGAMVYGLVRPESAGKKTLPCHEHFHLLCGTMQEAVSVCRDQVGHADAFFHFAWGGVNRAEIDSRAVQEMNIQGALQCLEAARQLGCRFFTDAGSRVEYGITPDGRMEESMECHPVNEYGKAKLRFYDDARQRCLQWGLTFYHLRFFSVYGCGDHPWSIISTLTRDLPQGLTVSLSACRHRWNFMEIEDAARAVVELYRFSDAHAGGSHVVNVASRDTRVLRDFVQEIQDLCGGKGSLEFGTFVQAKEGALSICPETGQLLYLTNGTWEEQIGFAEGIRRMLRESAGGKG